MNEPVCLGLSLLELSKILNYEFWYDYVKPKCDEKAKLCYMDTDSLTVYIKTDDIYKRIAEDVQTRFDASNYELECNFPNSPLRKKNEKGTGLMKSESGGNLMIKFVEILSKTYSDLIDEGKKKKSKMHKKMCRKKKA